VKKKMSYEWYQTANEAFKGQASKIVTQKQ